TTPTCRWTTRARTSRSTARTNPSSKVSATSRSSSPLSRWRNPSNWSWSTSWSASAKGRNPWSPESTDATRLNWVWRSWNSSASTTSSPTRKLLRDEEHPDLRRGLFRGPPWGVFGPRTPRPGAWLAGELPRRGEVKSSLGRFHPGPGGIGYLGDHTADETILPPDEDPEEIRFPFDR